MAVADKDKLLSKLEENEPELATTQEEECVICINAKATMQTAPCGHRVVCRKCFVKTIQMAVSQRLLPLRCVVCRAKILRLKQTGGGGAGSSGTAAGRTSSGMPASASAYSVATNGSSTGSMPNSDSLYSVSSGTSSISAASSLSSGSQCGGKPMLKCCSTAHCLGGAYPRQPTGALRRSQQHAMKLRLQEYWHGEAGAPGRLPPIRELPPCPTPGPQAASTRIRCAQKIVTQLETAPLPEKKSSVSQSKSSIIKSVSSNIGASTSKEIPYKQLQPEVAQNKKRNEKHEKSDNKKNEAAEKKREEKAKQKAEKEAKREAKKEAKKEEELAKKEAKEEKKKAKKEAKAAAAEQKKTAATGTS